METPKKPKPIFQSRKKKTLGIIKGQLLYTWLFFFVVNKNMCSHKKEDMFVNL